MCYFLDYVSAIMTKNVDQSILISDMLDFGSAHFSMELMRAAIEVSGVSFQVLTQIHFRLCSLREW